MTSYNKISFEIDGETFPIFSNKNIFEPNFTTKLLIVAAKKIIKKNQKVLDLGCGTGIIGCYFFKKKITNFIYGSDISNAAIKCSIFNADKLTNNHDIRLSNSLDAWREDKFNLIINDVSGISSELNNITDWFNFAPNNSGRDGIKFTIDILKKYKKNILNKGQLIFPVLGLSNRDKLISFLKKKKIDYKILQKREWPLPKNLLKHQDILNKLKKRKLINYNIKFGILFTTTEIFCCKYNEVK